MSPLDRLAPDAPLRLAAEKLLKPDPAARRDVPKLLAPLTRPWWEQPVPLDEPTVLAVLDVVFESSFPPPSDRWDTGPAQLVFALIGNVTPAALARIEAGYGTGDDRLALDLLTIVLSAQTVEASQTLVRLVRRHGWPPGFHARFFIELGRCTDHAAVLYPALLEVPGGPEVDLIEGLLKALRSGRFETERLRGSVVESGLPARLKALRLETAGPGPTYTALLELAGFIGHREVVSELREALAAEDPWPVLFAAVSLVRRGEPVAPDVFARLGALDQLRGPLFGLLQQVGQQDLIPPSARTREAFAASDITQWLAHPNELGRVPDALELMERTPVSYEGRPAEVFLWRFRAPSKPGWMAATSGPYPLDAPEGPLTGSLTFSKFEPWERRDARGHLASVQQTLEAWAAHRR